MSTSQNSTTLANLQRPNQAQQDVRVDMFSLQGFELAQRIAKAFAYSDAVPMIFRAQQLKKDKNGDFWVENPAAMGNCIVAIEVAQAVGMSVTAVMQNADVIQGKLRWSGKFVIAAINASRRFSPLEFSFVNKGPITAKYKEKTDWNKQLNRYNFVEREVQEENIECTAFAYMIENGKRTDKKIEGAPVSMKMVIEEGWYGKSDSKWQGEMRHLMFQYRAATFFGNIHAPDIIMGMGRSIEEERDIIDLDAQPDGSFAMTSAQAKPAAQAAAETATAAPTEAPTAAPAPEPTAAPTAAPAEAKKRNSLTAEEIAEIEAEERAQHEAQRAADADTDAQQAASQRRRASSGQQTMSME